MDTERSGGIQNSNMGGFNLIVPPTLKSKPKKKTIADRIESRRDQNNFKAHADKVKAQATNAKKAKIHDENRKN